MTGVAFADDGRTRSDDDGRTSNRVRVLMPAGAVALGSLARTSSTMSPVRSAPAATLEDDWTHAGTATAAEPEAAEPSGSAILELYRRTGLTWQQLATMFGVDRRAVHLWASGRKMSAANAQRLGRILALIRGSAASPTELRAWFLGLAPGDPPVLDLLAQGQTENIPPPPRSGDERLPAASLPFTAPRPSAFKPVELLDAMHDSPSRDRERVLARIPLRLPKDG